MTKRTGEWDADASSNFWAPTLAQQVAARREADRVAFATGWSRIFYLAAAVLVSASCALMAFR